MGPSQKSGASNDQLCTGRKPGHKYKVSLFVKQKNAAEFGNNFDPMENFIAVNCRHRELDMDMEIKNMENPNISIHDSLHDTDNRVDIFI